MAETPDSFELRPPLALYVATAFVLAACLFFISASAASMAASWDVCSVVSGALLLPIPVLLGVEQYRAAFRYNARAARRAGVALALISGLLWCGGVTTVYEITADGWQWGYWGPLAILFGAACLNTLAAWANFRWSRRLREAEAQGTLPNRAKRFSLRELLFVMAGCSIVAAAVGYVVRTTPPPYAEHVSADQAPVSLPKGAYDVSYAQGYRGVVAYEFSCDESAFIE